MRRSCDASSPARAPKNLANQLMNVKPHIACYTPSRGCGSSPAGAVLARLGDGAVGVDALGLGHLVHRRVRLLEGVAHEGALELLSLGGSGLLGGGAAPDGLARDRERDARSVSAP